jgi:hypothetical protein
MSLIVSVPSGILETSVDVCKVLPNLHTQSVKQKPFRDPKFHIPVAENSRYTGTPADVTLG